MVSSDRAPLLLTNYRGGGIGDFGLTFGAHLKSRLPGMETIETSVDGQGALRQAVRAATYGGPLIANLGLTAWGKSGLRNFIGFTAVGAHRTFAARTTVIVHHTIEIFDLNDTGYAVSRLVRVGAHVALRRVRKCDLVVFSPRLLRILTEQYGAPRVWLVPHPAERLRSPRADWAGGPPKVVHAGYWAVYKGIDRFVQTADRMRGRAEFVLVGRPHLALSADPGFRQRVEEWTGQAQRAGIRMTGYLTDKQLDAECTGAVVGLLPYSSMSGASGAFNLFASRGVPVVATDLPEFRYLESMGAGIRIAPATTEGLSSAVAEVVENRDQWLELSRRQGEFVERYSWEHFIDELLARAAGRAAPPSAVH